MRIYWYWPFLREGDLSLVNTLAGPGFDLVVQTLDRPGAPDAVLGDRLEIRPDLREVRELATWSPRWAADRVATYAARTSSRRAIIRSSPDITHVWFLNRFADAASLPRLARRHHTVVNVHDVTPHNQRLPTRLERMMLARIYESDATLIVHHQMLRERLFDAFDVDPERVEVIPHLVRPRPSTTPTKHSGRRVLFFGTFRNNKGLPILLDAIEQSSPDIEWEIAGRGEHHLQVAVQASATSHQNVSARIGMVPEIDKAAMFERADLVVMPYTAFESQSGVLHDAYSHGVPVVVTDVGALGDTVREDRTGVVVSAGDASSIAAAIEELLGNDERRQELTDATEAVASQRSPAAIGELLTRLYNSILA